MHRLLPVLFIGLLLGSCGQSGERTEVPGDSWLQGQLDELKTLPAPEGVTEETWEQLKQALRQAIVDHPRTVSATSVHPKSAAELSEFFGDLEWRYSLSGDYDQNGEVNISDLTPLGVNLGESTGGGGPFAYSTALSVIDGDSNGEINLADISPIGAAIGTRCSHYNVYQSPSASDYPVAPGDPDSVSPVASVALSEATGAKNTDRLQFSLPLPAGGGNFWVRIADGESIGTPSNMIMAGEPSPTEPPMVSFTVDVSEGPAPLTVNFDASASTCDDSYFWDFDGDGSSDTFDGQVMESFTYDTPGRYNATLSMSNNRGPAEYSLEILVTTAGGGLPPVAALTVDPQAAVAPAMFTLDASASSDSDGTLVSADFDIDNDGVFDILDVPFPAATTMANYTPEQAGIYTITVQVHDSEGLTHTAQAQLQVLNAWEVIEDVAPEYPYASIPAVVGSVGGKPALLYGAYYSGLVYSSAQDALGNDWNPPTIVDYNDSFLSIKEGVIMEIDGLPAIFYIEHADGFDPPFTTSVIFRRALDIEGTQWGPRIVVLDYGEEDVRDLSAAMVNGRPALALAGNDDRAVMFVRANDAQGTSWGEPVNVHSINDFVYWVELEVVNGNPAILYNFNFFPGMRYKRALDADGTTWGADINIDESLSPALDGDYADMTIIAGRPAIAFYDRVGRDMQYTRADDADGASWTTYVTLPDTAECFGASMVEFNGRPLMVYEDHKKVNNPHRVWEIYSSYASDADGTTWDRVPMQTNGHDQGPTVLIIGGVPMAAFIAADNIDEDGNVRFARLN